MNSFIFDNVKIIRLSSNFDICDEKKLAQKVKKRPNEIKSPAKFIYDIKMD